LLTAEPERVSNFRDGIVKKTLELDLNVDSFASIFKNFQLSVFASRSSMQNIHRIRIVMAGDPSTNQRVIKTVSLSFC
jgi:hypothetical protein